MNKHQPDMFEFLLRNSGFGSCDNAEAMFKNLFCQNTF